MALTLAAGASAGAVPQKWGGVFGQEWTAGALCSLPSAAGRCGGLEMTQVTCGFAAPLIGLEGGQSSTQSKSCSSAQCGKSKPAGRKFDRARRRRVMKRITKVRVQPGDVE